MSFQITTREIQYHVADGTVFIGYLALPKTTDKVPGVLVSPEWWGRNEYTEQRARELATQGYAALAIDMYGEKKSTTDATQASEWMMETFKAPNIIVDRANAALHTLAQLPEVQSNRLAAIGFCYGGKVALDLARSGAPLRAVITFHANLSAQQSISIGQIQAEILVLHGELDTMVSLDDVATFKSEMSKAQVEHEVIIFENAKHGFSNLLADERAKANGVDLGYQKEAEQQGLAAMYQLLQKQLHV